MHNRGSKQLNNRAGCVLCRCPHFTIMVQKTKTPGWENTPIEAYLSSESTKHELYEIVCIMWRKKDTTPDLVRAIFEMLYKKAHATTSATIAKLPTKFSLLSRQLRK